MTAKTRETTDKKPAGKPAAKTAAAKKPAAKKPAAKPAKVAEAPKPAKAPITHEMIAARAYHIWLAAGCPPGQEAAIWLRAEAELR